jgi:hypothetical protein
MTAIIQPELRRFPYPYRAALSITSDIDNTDTCEQFMRIQTFMNTEIGIKFTNTFFPFHEDKKLSLLSGKSDHQEMIIDHIKAGAIDAIHSFGEKRNFTREDAKQALDTLKKNQCLLDIWIDHAQSPSNFCKYRYAGKGDVVGAKEYHLDMLKSYGVKFIWTERLTNIIGQGVPLKFSNVLAIYDSDHAVSSIVNLCKTAAKIILGVCGFSKYDFFKSNEVVKISTMVDGQRMYEFIRFNNHYKGAAIGDTFEDLSYLISKDVLEKLKTMQGYCIVYIHLGKKFNLTSTEGKKTMAALLHLRREHEDGWIYIDGASRILNYYIRHKYLNWHAEKRNGWHKIIVNTVDDPIFGAYVPVADDLKGFTFYVPGDARIFINKTEVTGVKNNPPDHTNRRSITIK